MLCQSSIIKSEIISRAIVVFMVFNVEPGEENFDRAPRRCVNVPNAIQIWLICIRESRRVDWKRFGASNNKIVAASPGRNGLRIRVRSDMVVLNGSEIQQKTPTPIDMIGIRVRNALKKIGPFSINLLLTKF